MQLRIRASLLVSYCVNRHPLRDTRPRWDILHSDLSLASLDVARVQAPSCSVSEYAHVVLAAWEAAVSLLLACRVTGETNSLLSLLLACRYMTGPAAACSRTSGCPWALPYMHSWPLVTSPAHVPHLQCTALCCDFTLWVVPGCPTFQQRYRRRQHSWLCEGVAAHCLLRQGASRLLWLWVDRTTCGDGVANERRSHDALGLAAAAQGAQ